MSDPTTELAREFLEFKNYIVKKETKFYKNRKIKGTLGDIDIIAVSCNLRALARNRVPAVASQQIVFGFASEVFYSSKSSKVLYGNSSALNNPSCKLFLGVVLPLMYLETAPSVIPNCPANHF